MPKFSEPIGPVFHYEEPTNDTFGDQPHLRDPLDKKYVYLKSSTTFDLAGEGAFAARDVPANTGTAICFHQIYFIKFSRNV